MQVFVSFANYVWNRLSYDDWSGSMLPCVLDAANHCRPAAATAFSKASCWAQLLVLSQCAYPCQPLCLKATSGRAGMLAGRAPLLLQAYQAA